MLFRDHVIYLVREEAYLGRKQTILAAEPGPFDDFTPRLSGDVRDTHDARAMLRSMPALIITIMCSSRSYSSSSAFSVGAMLLAASRASNVLSRSVISGMGAKDAICSADGLFAKVQNVPVDVRRQWW